jgi:hypothetical protein
MKRRSVIPPQLGTSFAVHQARQLGVTRARLRGGDLRISFRGARSLHHAAPVAPEENSSEFFARQSAEFLQRCRDYLPVAPPDFRFSGLTAARIYGMPLPWRLPRTGSLEVAVAATAQRPRRLGVTGRRLASLPPAVIREELPVLPPEQLWFDLASVLTVDELVVAGDYLVRRKRPETSMERLHAQVAISRGRHGSKRARDALRDIRPGTDSPKESDLRLLLVRAGLPEPVVGFQVRDPNGDFVGVPDLAYVAERIALDYDGEVHRTDERVFLDDIERRERFEDVDWRYVRVSKDHLKRPGTFLERVRRLLRERGRRP